MSTIERSCIKEGDYTILKRGTTSQLCQVLERKPVFFCKQKILLNHVIGLPYGSLFKLKGKDLFLVQEASVDLPIEVESSAKDNRSLHDDGTSQQLTKEEIEQLKQEGASSETIVKNLVANSLTFNSKTHYSQEKYVKKKKEKYVNYIRVSKTNIRHLAELYHRNGPTKICNMRVDTISQMLTAVNVMSGGQYLVVDSCLGLLVAAVLEQALPGGKVLQVYTEPGPVSSYRHAVSAMNYSDDIIQSSLFGISHHTIRPENEKAQASLQPQNGVVKEHSDDQSKVTTSLSEASNNTIPLEGKRSIESPDNSNTFLEKKKAKMDRKVLRKIETEKALELLGRNSLDGLLVCCRSPPAPLALELLDYLAPSRPFAVHCMMLQPLVEAYDQIKSSNKAIFLKLSETWLRKYQVLPDRTHPEINMSNTGGYLLTGIKVEPVSR